MTTLDANPRTSAWGDLSPHLIARFYDLVKAGGGSDRRWVKNSGGAVVCAPLMEANLDISLGWQSPFEQSGPEQSAPALMAMLQSGAMSGIIETMMPGGAQQETKAQAGEHNSWLEKADKWMQQAEGRTGITKLNSTQVFAGMPPLKFTVTALFRAWADPVVEVENPVDQLIAWALPTELSNDPFLLARMARDGFSNPIETLLPSRAPTPVAMEYKGRVYSPLVIESVGLPLGSPVDSRGNFVELVVSLTLCTLTAWDRGDWASGI